MTLVPRNLVREVDLHLAKIGEASEDSFVVLPPEKEGEFKAVVFADGKVIRREIGVTNQMFPHEIVQIVEPGESVPKYHLSDPNNNSGVGKPAPACKKLCS